MINDSSLIFLYEIIPPEERYEALKVLNVLLDALQRKEQLNRTQIQSTTGLSYQIAGKWIDAWEHKGFIRCEVGGRGRSKIYGLTKTGIRFLKLHKEGLV